jgi:copper chaperone CopZ
MKIVIALIALAAFSNAAQADTIQMRVHGQMCRSCAQDIEKTLRKNAAAADVMVSLEDHLVAVEIKPGRDISDDELKKALIASGYDVKSIERTSRSVAQIRAILRWKPR